MIKNSISILITFLVLISLSGCSSKEQINSNPQMSNNYDIAENARKEMYNKEGYIEGKKDGFKEGVSFMKTALAEFMNEVRAIQFSSYLIKEKYIQPGEIYIEKDGKIVLGAMKIQHPYTLADIYNKFSDKIPVYAKESNTNGFKNLSLDNSSEEVDKQNIDETAALKKKNAFNPTIHPKEPENRIENKETIKNTSVKVLRTNENEQILNKLGFPYGKMDNHFLVEFSSKSESDIFCNNLNLCVEY